MPQRRRPRRRFFARVVRVFAKGNGGRSGVDCRRCVSQPNRSLDDRQGETGDAARGGGNPAERHGNRCDQGLDRFRSAGAVRRRSESTHADRSRHSLQGRRATRDGAGHQSRQSMVGRRPLPLGRVEPTREHWRGVAGRAASAPGGISGEGHVASFFPGRLAANHRIGRRGTGGRSRDLERRRRVARQAVQWASRHSVRCRVVARRKDAGHLQLRPHDPTLERGDRRSAPYAKRT